MSLQHDDIKTSPICHLGIFEGCFHLISIDGFVAWRWNHGERERSAHPFVAHRPFAATHERKHLRNDMHKMHTIPYRNTMLLWKGCVR